MRHYITLVLGILCAVLLGAPVLAQGRLLIHDPLNQLRQPALIQQAAAPLIERGAIVVVYVKARGNDADFIQLLKRDGFVRSDGKARVDLIAIYVAIADNYSALRYGERWQMQLDGSYRQILREHLHTPLSSPNLSSDISAALAAVEQSIASWVADAESRDVLLNGFPFSTLLSIGSVIFFVVFISMAFVMLKGIRVLPRSVSHKPLWNGVQAESDNLSLATLARRFVTVTEKLCAQAGVERFGLSQKSSYQGIWRELLQLRCTSASMSTSSSEELNRLAQQLATFEQSVFGGALLGDNRVDGSPFSSPTLISKNQLRRFRQLLRTAALQLWRLEWAFAREPATVNKADVDNLVQRFEILLFDIVVTTASVEAAIAAAQDIWDKSRALLFELYSDKDNRRSRDVDWSSDSSDSGVSVYSSFDSGWSSSSDSGWSSSSDSGWGSSSDSGWGSSSDSGWGSSSDSDWGDLGGGDSGSWSSE